VRGACRYRALRSINVVTAVYYFGRFAQLVGMWLLLVDLFTAGPLGPNPRLFAAGVVVFLVGWGLTKLRGRN
jgi:hypothetical protein